MKPSDGPVDSGDVGSVNPVRGPSSRVRWTVRLVLIELYTVCGPGHVLFGLPKLPGVWGFAQSVTGLVALIVGVTLGWWWDREPK